MMHFLSRFFTNGRRPYQEADAPSQNGYVDISPYNGQLMTVDHHILGISVRETGTLRTLGTACLYLEDGHNLHRIDFHRKDPHYGIEGIRSIKIGDEIIYENPEIPFGKDESEIKIKVSTPKSAEEP